MFNGAGSGGSEEATDAILFFFAIGEMSVFF
jgi:hypothetical protein